MIGRREWRANSFNIPTENKCGYPPRHFSLASMPAKPVQPEKSTYLSPDHAGIHLSLDQFLRWGTSHFHSGRIGILTFGQARAVRAASHPLLGSPLYAYVYRNDVRRRGSSRGRADS